MSEGERLDVLVMPHPWSVPYYARISPSHPFGGISPNGGVNGFEKAERSTAFESPAGLKNLRS